MNTINSNGMSDKVAAANIVKHFDEFVISDGKISAKFFGHYTDTYQMIDGADPIDNAQGLIDFAGAVYGHINFGKIIAGDKEYDFTISTNAPILDSNENFIGLGVRIRIYDGDNVIANYSTTIGKVWSKKTMAWAMTTLYEFMSNIAYEQDMERFEKESELMWDRVADYQTECDGYVDDLKMVAEKYDDIESRFDALICAEILKKIAKLSDDCLVAVGDICGCEMVWGDGYHIDLSEIERWRYGAGDCGFDGDDLQELIDALDYMSSSESDLPLGLEQESIDWIVAGDGAACVGMQPDYTGETAYNFVMANV